MPERKIGINVFEAGLNRILKLYKEGHRVVVSFSGGKDSGVCLELAIIAAKMTGNLPVDVMMRDEEIMLPGTFEYSERIAQRPEVRFHWLIANQPITNCFNRVMPYFWVFDPLLSPDKWVRKPPSYAEYIDMLCIDGLITEKTYPSQKGKYVVNIMGLRCSESINRKAGLISSGSCLTKLINGRRNCRPIYDWMDSDIWRAIYENKWDYNHAYDMMFRYKLPLAQMRIAPPTLVAAGTANLQMAYKAWPKWFYRVSERLPGVREIAMFGRIAVEPIRKTGESWKDTFMRECIGSDTPAWIIPRAEAVMKFMLARHRMHSGDGEFPQIRNCHKCGKIGSWKALGRYMYGGDPFCLSQDILSYIEPEFFRKGAGYWYGSPTFK